MEILRSLGLPSISRKRVVPITPHTSSGVLLPAKLCNNKIFKKKKAKELKKVLPARKY